MLRILPSSPPPTVYRGAVTDVIQTLESLPLAHLPHFEANIDLLLRYERLPRLFILTGTFTMNLGVVSLQGRDGASVSLARIFTASTSGRYDYKELQSRVVTAGPCLMLHQYPLAIRVFEGTLGKTFDTLPARVYTAEEIAAAVEAKNAADHLTLLPRWS